MACGICHNTSYKGCEARTPCQHGFCFDCLVAEIDFYKAEKAPIICPDASCAAVVKEFTHNGNIYQIACGICGDPRFKDHMATTSPCKHSFCYSCLKTETGRCKQERAPYVCPAAYCKVVMTKFTHSGGRIHTLDGSDDPSERKRRRIAHEDKQAPVPKNPKTVCGICKKSGFRGNRASTPCLHVFCFSCLKAKTGQNGKRDPIECPSCSAWMNQFTHSGNKIYLLDGRAAEPDIISCIAERIEIQEIDRDGRFIRLRNTGEQKMYLDGLTIQHGNFYYEKTEFKFHDRSEIVPGGTVTIWSSGLGVIPSFPERKVMRAPLTWTALTIPDGLVITTLIHYGKIIQKMRHEKGVLTRNIISPSYEVKKERPLRTVVSLPWCPTTSSWRP